MSRSLRDRAVQLLARREHSRAELARKLAGYAETEEALALLLDELSDQGLLSDARYVDMRLNARQGRYGNARLAQELQQQGVSRALIDEALSNSTNELERARLVWQRKFGELAGPDQPGERARQHRFLMARGFSADVIRRIMRGDFSDE